MSTKKNKSNGFNILECIRNGSSRFTKIWNPYTHNERYQFCCAPNYLQFVWHFVSIFSLLLIRRTVDMKNAFGRQLTETTICKTEPRSIKSINIQYMRTAHTCVKLRIHWNWSELMKNQSSSILAYQYPDTPENVFITSHRLIFNSRRCHVTSSICASSE